jgi:predicted esterase
MRRSATRLWLALIGFAPALAAQAPTPSTLSPAPVLLPFPKGRVAERLRSLADSTEEYAVYLPSKYSADQRWPLLLIMDPRGRALIPLNRVVEVAERLGYIAISSYNSRSDEAIDPNADAINAILRDADRLLSVDPHRIYLVGQSGTARASWVFGAQLKGNVAGLIGFGAALPRGYEVPAREPGTAPAMVFYGAAGTTDFNFDEMLPLDTLLDRVNLPHRIGWFPGPHAWPEADVFADAVEWVELMAMKFGLKPTDQRWVDSTYQVELDEGKAREASGDPYGAWRIYRNLAADYAGMVEVAAASARKSNLGESQAVKQASRRLGEIVQQQLAYNRKLGTFLYEFRGATPPSIDESLRRLELRELQRRAANGKDSMDAWAATRSLDNIWAYVSFYEPQDYLAAGNAGHALAILGIAQVMRPNSADVCYQRARALMTLDRGAEAIDAVECLVRSGVPMERIQKDPLLAGVRKLLASRTGGAASPPGAKASKTGQRRRWTGPGDYAGGN